MILSVQANKAAFQIFSQDFPNLKLALEGKKVKKNEEFSGYEIDGLLVCIEPEIVILVESKTNLKSEDVDQVVKAADKLKTQCKDPRLTLSPEYVKVIEVTCHQGVGISSGIRTSSFANSK